MAVIKKNAPFLKDKVSTQKIMFELTIALLVVYAFSLYRAYVLGSGYFINVLLMMLTSIITSLVVEAGFAFFTKQNVVGFLKKSFPLVTPIIFVLTLPINTSLYPVIIATAFGVFFGKLVFGGFGQNIFNPAAVARAIIFASFAASLNVELMTSATPCLTIKSTGWLVSGQQFGILLNDFGGFANLFVGNYSGAIGETSTLILILCGIYLSVRKVIDWKIPVFYLLTIFVGASLVGFAHGLDFRYGLFHILVGGAMFGAIFMLTDPVTSPVTVSGKIFYSIIAALITLLIRFKANAPEGVLYSILIVNMLVQVIEKIFDSKQMLAVKRNYLILSLTFVLSIFLIGILGVNLKQTKEYSSILKPNFARGEAVDLNGDFSQFKAKLLEEPKKEGELSTYKIQAKGYGLIDPDKQGGDGYDYNTFSIKIDEGKKVVKEVIFEKFGDTKNVGDKASDKEFLRQFEGAKVEDKFDVVSGATWTSKSVMAAIQLALNGGSYYQSSSKIKIEDSENYKQFIKDAKIENPKKDLYVVSVKGYGLIDPDNHGGDGYDFNVFEIEIKDQKVVSLKFKKFGDTKGIGDKTTNAMYLEQFLNKGLGDEVDILSGATWTSKSIVSAISLALKEASK